MLKTTALNALCTVVIALLFVGAHAQAQVDNGCTDEAGVRHDNCSRLNAHDSATIKATDCGTSTSTAPGCSTAEVASITTPSEEDAAECRTITNNSSVNYFVPWKTPAEWGAFLAWVKSSGLGLDLEVESCCSPKVGAVCADQIYGGVFQGPDGVPVFDPTTGAPIQLGKRFLGKRCNPGDSACLASRQFYGAENDISTSLDAAVLLNDTTINYKVTYVCDGGDWVKSYEEGSCAPIDGACGATIPNDVTPTLLATYVQQRKLCAPGSIMQNLVDHNTHWSWDCLGTPTRATATCSVTNSITGNGPQCGLANFGRLGSMPSTPSALCAVGTPTAISGVGTQASPWRWDCDNGNPPTLNGSSRYVSCLAYHEGESLDGVCGADNGYSTTNAQWNPTALCANGTQLSNDGIRKDASGWTWNCAGENGGNASQDCVAALTSEIGVCNRSGVSDSWGTTPPNPLTDVMCSRGTPTAVTHGQNNSGQFVWSWQCLGPGNVGRCTHGHQCTCEKYDLNGAQPGTCGGDQGSPWFGTLGRAPTRLCEANSIAITAPVWNASLTPPQWEWTCQGLNGGSTTACQTGNRLANGHCNDAYLSGTGFTLNPLTAVPRDICGTTDPINASVQGAHYVFDCPGTFGGAAAHCTIAYDATPLPGLCGTAHNTQQTTAPSGAVLCARGSAGAVANTGVGWSWACQGEASTLPVQCNATIGGGGVYDGLCGSAHNSPSAAAPTSNLCAVGIPTIVTGIGPWTWGCQSTVVGGATATCVATVPLATGPGICGPVDGLDIPVMPNTNLCSNGNPTTVTGTGPWEWDCVGSTTASCSADMCQVCSGDLPAVTMSASLPAQTINYGGGLCEVSGTVQWSVVNTLVNGNATQTVTFTNASAGVSFSKAVVPPAAPANYCPPCAQRIKLIGGGNFVIRKTGTGTCSGSSLDNGLPVTVPADGISVY